MSSTKRTVAGEGLETPASGKTLIIVNVFIVAAMICLILFQFMNHDSYGFLAALGAAIGIVVTWLSIIPDFDTEPFEMDDGSHVPFILTGAVTGAAWLMLWYIFDWNVGLMVAIFALAYLSIFRFKLVKTTQGTFATTAFFTAAILSFTATTMPAKQVSKTAEGFYSYSESAVPFAFLEADYVTYYSLHTGKVTFAGLPEGWTGSGSFTFTELGELSSDDFEALLNQVDNSSGTSTIPYIVDIETPYETATGTALAIQSQLAETYPQIRVAVTMTYTVSDTATVN